MSNSLVEIQRRIIALRNDIIRYDTRIEEYKFKHTRKKEELAELEMVISHGIKARNRRTSVKQKRKALRSDLRYFSNMIAAFRDERERSVKILNNLRIKIQPCHRHDDSYSQERTIKKLYKMKKGPPASLIAKYAADRVPSDVDSYGER